jgi:starch phosphorylase
MRDRWSSLRFGDVRVQTGTGRHRFEATAYLDGLDPDSVLVELFADGIDGSEPVRVGMRRETPLVGARGFVYVAEVPDTRPTWHFTPRLVGLHPEVAVPLEMPLITWAQ